MDRQIVFPGAIPLETDLLNTNKYAMIGLSKLAAAVLGVSTFLNGLACTPNSPADLTVKVAPGEIYSLQNIDGTAYSSIAADTTHAILKQGISLDQLTLSCPAPVTVGQSVNYLIQVAYQDTDANATVLPYYNSSNPSLAYSGPNNSGTAQNTVRKGVCTVSAKAGVAATTGSQTTPAPDAGYIGAFVVTVAYGQTQINAGNISTYAGAPFIPSGGLIVGGLQQNACISSVAGGTADALTGSFFPGITALPASGAGVLTLYVRPTAANATTTPTFTPNSGVIAAKTIVKGAGAALAAGDIAGAGHWIELQYDATLDKWVLLNPANGISGQSNHGQCRLSLVGGNLKLAPFNGNKLIINGVAQSIPSGGVTLAPPATTLTLYYIYAYMNAGTMTLEASATGHATDATTGVEVKSGDATRTLVGMARTVSNAWVDTAAQRFVLSWFNRRLLAGQSFFTANRSTASTSFVELNTEIRNEFLTWGQDGHQFNLVEFPSSSIANYSPSAGIVVDGALIDAVGASNTIGSGTQTNHCMSVATPPFSEGYHWASIQGAAQSGATITWAGSASTSTSRTTLSMTNQG